jgi:hypothetical protein
MARIPTPDRGQPIDVPYIYQLANAVNDLADQIDDSSQRLATIFTRDAQRQDLRTSDARIFASFQDLVSQQDVQTGSTREFVFQLDGFKYPPIATVSPINTGTSVASNDVLTVITSITNSEVRGFVRFNSAGIVSVSVNIIAIGVPE